MHHYAITIQLQCFSVLQAYIGFEVVAHILHQDSLQLNTNKYELT